ncbi:hypothetical protein GM661_02060 [Iocasia frigidifontis]|uniref:Uncharacterized protein n=1 Tax=Iocasia fonsfrigidae TaxID=2682810 RepID=A0A8A7KG42_9FIRM|nr:hypothetical protein [Iocasia fonsfrigidae]QTL96842.1 hypothetical protein GM661_02060 [Iocasia fonsfrigidae]
MFKKTILLIFIFFFITGLFTSRLEAVQETPGYIKAVDLAKNAVLINDSWYHLSDSSEVFRNGQESSLQAALPIEGSFFQWGKVELNNRGKVAKLQVYYQVYEGKITELSLSDRIIRLSIFKGDGLAPESEYFYWSNDIINKEMDLLKKGEHLVLIAAQNIVIHFPSL